MDRSTVRLSAAAAKQRQNDVLANAKSVVDEHTQWILSHLSQADRDLIRGVTGEVIEPGQKTASIFALSLAETRLSKTAVSDDSTQARMAVSPRQEISQHERVATFTSMRLMLGNSMGRALDTEA